MQIISGISDGETRRVLLANKPTAKSTTSHRHLPQRRVISKQRDGSEQPTSLLSGGQEHEGQALTEQVETQKIGRSLQSLWVC